MTKQGQRCLVPILDDDCPPLWMASVMLMAASVVSRGSTGRAIHKFGNAGGAVQDTDDAGDRGHPSRYLVVVIARRVAGRILLDYACWCFCLGLTRETVRARKRRRRAISLGESANKYKPDAESRWASRIPFLMR